MFPLMFLLGALALTITGSIALAIWLNDGPRWAVLFIGVIIAAMFAM